ncbi:winged helix DNA-binding domain-containing protein [Anaeromyxobacter terrae]|uniref:winged helix DNA-binding domain-containing protein n=1 Tax=Anaeromyxobacter terrae TaxID=2925406 RepID=UPI001F564151|nr:winged helix DNA-binding domain-containing protein [Anaeromyxobacter sp. SG22]
MPDRPLSLRALNRATLARQLLLARERTPLLRALERVAGLQAQLARPPFIGLWSRVDGFRRDGLKKLVASRAVVRGPLMRTTLHLVSAADFLRLRGPLQPALDGALRIVSDRLAGVELPRVTAAARALFEGEPRTFDELRPLLAARFPGVDPRAIGYAVRTQLPLVQVPSDDAWAFHGSGRFTLAEVWLGEPVPDERSPEALIVRYLAAFGPATAADVQAWSGLGRLDGALAAVRPKLRSFRDGDGRELLDLPRAPLPPEDTPAPVRFLPEWDNLLLAHADRRRVVADAHRKALVTKNLQVPPTFLVDGFAAGRWRIAGSGKRAKLELQPFAPLPRRTRDALEEEGERLVGFVVDDEDAAPARARRS